jgi:phosphatidylinositol glycan class S
MVPVQPSPLRDPSLLSYQKDGLRRSIIAAYWIVIILALPLWWSTTSIKRLSLSSTRLLEQTQRRLDLPVTICVESDPLFVAELKQALANLAYEDPLQWRGISVDVVSQTDCGTSFLFVP